MTHRPNRHFTTTSSVSPNYCRLELLLKYHALILASGKGSRLGALSTRRPKCLLPLGSETILDRQLRLLQDVGVSTVTMVVGHQRHLITARMGTRVRTIVNDRYATTSSISSLWAARDSLSENTLILNSDLVFERGLLESVMNSPDPWALAIDSERRCSGHIRMVIEERRPVQIGRTVSAERSQAAFLCVGLVRQEGLATFKHALATCAQESLHTGWSKVFLSLAMDNHNVALCEYAGPWFDVNSVAAYRKARLYVTSGTQPDG
ncbi:MAG: phosphocholine cytidylyltransferase family protein [Dehalococcoidia bacterium]|nr:phosphocholine cytidylyltransferase family protein [Dehalococcoidia bacterium]